MRIHKLAALIVIPVAALGLTLAGCGTTKTVVIRQQPAPTVTKVVHRPKVVHAAPAVTAQPAAPTQAPAQPAANAEAVVTQFYQDLSTGDYADAWAIGGMNIAGTDYNSWVAGYATTTSITLNTESQWNATTVNASITATQSDGGSTTYQGTYTVIGGVITSANIVETS